MICDKCVKKRVCRLFDGSNVQGCIEFYRPHEEVLQEVKDYIIRLQNSGPGKNKSLEYLEKYVDAKIQDHKPDNIKINQGGSP